MNVQVLSHTFSARRTALITPLFDAIVNGIELTTWQQVRFGIRFLYCEVTITITAYLMHMLLL